MDISANKIIGSRVLTKSGDYLGKVIDFKINNLNQTIKQYHVKRGIFSGLSKSPLIISANQVISLKEDTLIVEDAVIKKGIKERKESLIGVNVS
ncbi:MAG TPA: hypothetical protein ENI16_00390 [Candidatus Portnoybacteria bacterium]|nr:hypothetical protein [Candidatus Portnoybacteria bacterium]